MNNLNKISDGLLEIELDLEKAQFLLGDITQEYFDEYEPRTETGRDCIALDFNRYGAYSNIALDYVAKVSESIETLKGIIEQAPKN